MTKKVAPQEQNMLGGLILMAFVFIICPVLAMCSIVALTMWSIFG